MTEQNRNNAKTLDDGKFRSLRIKKHRKEFTNELKKVCSAYENDFVSQKTHQATI